MTPFSRQPSPSEHHVGVFGDLLPDCLLEAVGARCVPVHLPDVTGAALPEIPAVSSRLEGFLDDHVRQFLLRFAGGHFDGLPAIVFCREDAAAHVAYVYAAELQRQGLAPAAPRLILWNMVHRPGPAARMFNLRACEALWHDLAAVGLARPDPAALARAHAMGLERQTALMRVEALQRADPPRLSGADVLALRLARRSLAPQDHLQLLELALDGADQAPPRAGLRIGCVGSALSSVAAHHAVEVHGTVVCDLLPLGESWPVPLPDAFDGVQSVLDAAAGFALCPRIVPTGRHRAELVRRLVEARCDLVLIQLSQGDDSFGWEIPDLTRDLRARGIGVLNLGFRDSRPGTGWLADAGAAVAAYSTEPRA